MVLADLQRISPQNKSPDFLHATADPCVPTDTFRKKQLCLKTPIICFSSPWMFMTCNLPKVYLKVNFSLFPPYLSLEVHVRRKVLGKGTEQPCTTPLTAAVSPKFVSEWCSSLLGHQTFVIRIPDIVQHWFFYCLISYVDFTNNSFLNDAYT